jgi:hypothetical protein
MGLLLYIIASILEWVFAPVAYLYGFFASLAKREFNDYHKNLAIAKDQYGNAICRYIFNWLLIKKDGYKFGNVDETISSVIGKNKVKNTLTFCGKILDTLLDFFDDNHSIESIDNTEQNDN